MLRRISAYLDTESWVALQNAYEQWRFFPPDRLTFNGSRETGRFFDSAKFSPEHTCSYNITSDPIYGGPALPHGGACQQITSYLQSLPHFGESLRVINLTGQCVSLEQVSELFSETLSPRLPKLKSASLRIFISALSNPPTSNAVAPPELQRLEIFVNKFSLVLTSEMLLPLMPLVRKVKYIGWFCLSFDMENIISERLDALTTLETIEQTLWQFGSFPSDVMPSLERLIVHGFRLSYSVRLKKIYEAIGQTFSIRQTAR